MFSEIVDSVFIWLQALVIAIARLLPCMILVPIFASRELKGILRTGLAIALSLVVTPVIYHHLAAESVSYLMLALYTFKEAVIGVLLGSLLALPFWMFDSIGGLLDTQRGALIGGQYNPALANVSSPIGHMLQQFLIIILITTGGINLALNVIWSSYGLWMPLEPLPFGKDQNIDIWLDVLAEFFKNLVLYAAPLVLLLFFIDFTMGILGLYSPQLQVFILAMPVKSLAGLFLLVVYLPMLWELGIKEIEKLKDISAILMKLSGGP